MDALTILLAGAVAVAAFLLVRLLAVRLVARWRERWLARVGKRMSEVALMQYLATRELEFLCCDFAALFLLGVDPKTPLKDLTPEQRAALKSTAADIEEAAERLVARGLLAPHEERFDFRSPEGVTTSQRCRTPGLYSLTNAGREDLRQWPKTKAANRATPNG